jgi:phosphate starvation-inducible PhoH-like protein
MSSIEDNTFTFVTGYAGSGKTLLAIFMAMKLLKDKTSKINQITVIRPYVRHKLESEFGALPGSLDEKMRPFGESIVDNLKQFCQGDEITDLFHNKQISFSPISMLRGRTFDRHFVIVEEAQNLKEGGAYAIMSRIGNDTKCVFCGDLMQADSKERSDLETAKELLGREPRIPGVRIVRLYNPEDVQRNKLLYKIMERFNQTRPELATADPFGG